MAIRNIALAVSILAFSSVAASAADLPMRTKAPPLVVSPAYNWTGFYVGGNIGYAWGNADTFFNPLPSAATWHRSRP